MVKTLKALIASSIIFAMVSSSFAAFSGTSARMQGINPDLIGFVSDEYSDAMSVNVADTLNVKGYRLYTNFSNLYDGNEGNDAMFNGAGVNGGATNGGSYLLGGFGNPLGNVKYIDTVFKDAQVGAFYTATSIFTPQTTQLALAASAGDETQNTVVVNDNDNDKILGSAGDTKVTTNQSAKRILDTKNSDMTFLFARPCRYVDNLNLGVKIMTSNVADGVATSEEPINSAYYQSTLTYGTPNTTVYEDDSQVAKEKYENSTLSMDFGGRYQLNDKIDLGLVVTYEPIKIEQTRTSSVSMTIDNTAGAAQPISATATMVDGTQSAGNLGGLAPGDGGLVSGGFVWTANSLGTQFLGPNGEMNIIGFTNGNEIGTYKAEGTRLTLGVDKHYKMREDLTLYGRVSYDNLPGSIASDFGTTYKETLRTVGTDGLVGNADPTEVAGDTQSTNNITDYDISGGKWEDSTIGVQLGGQATLENNVLFGFGIIIAKQTQTVSYDWQEDINNVITYDAANDGFQNSVAVTDFKVTTTDTNTGKVINETETDTFSIPLGFELRPLKKFPVRLGATHQVQTTKTTVTNDVLTNGLLTTTTETGGNSAAPTVATVSGNTGKTETYTETVTHGTQYYYGIGYEWSENLTFDILGIANPVDHRGTAGPTNVNTTTSSIFDLSSWRISATMKF